MQTQVQQTEHLDTSSSANLVTIPGDYVERVWPLIEGMAEKACTEWHGCYAPEDIKKLSQEKKIQLWTAWRGKKPVCLLGTQIYSHPQMKVCEIMFVGGEDMDSWVDYMKELMDWATQMGCRSLVARGRLGWERVLKQYGFEADRILLRRELDV